MNIGEWIEKRAFTHPDREFLKDGERVFSNRSFNERVNRTARALQHLDIVKGERLALIMGNTSEFLEIFFACAKTGAILVPVNHRLAGPEIEYILRDSAPRGLVYAAEFAEKALPLKDANLGMRHWIRHEGDPLPGESLLSDLTAAEPDVEPAPVEDVTDEDPLFIMYTSGTTGDPKGAVLTHGNILFGAVHSLIGYGVNRTYRSLVVAPLFHIGALAASVTPVIYAGGSVVLSGFFNASEVLLTIVRERINYMFAVPVMFQLMADTPEWAGADLSHVHFFISGGAPIPLPVIRKYQDEKGIGFVQGYALTETGRLTSLDLEDAVRKAGSVGKEVFHVRLRIIDEEDRDVAPGEPGEIVVKGPNVFSGYWRKPKETALARKDGWFRTGDMGRRDGDGFLYIIGRKVEMIISSGENIYPAEVERAIQSLPAVKEAAAVGMPDPKRGEVVAAFVLLKEGETVTEDEILAGLQGKIAPFKMPKRVFFVESFPRNPGGKVLKRILQKRLREG